MEVAVVVLEAVYEVSAAVAEVSLAVSALALALASNAAAVAAAAAAAAAHGCIVSSPPLTLILETVSIACSVARLMGWFTRSLSTKFAPSSHM